MLKRLSTYIAILLGLACMIFGYVSFENWRFRQAALKELGPILADEQEQKNELLALGEVDLNPSDLTLATLEQRLKRAVLKRSGDFNSTRLGGACGKERCAIWATFLVPLGQDIQPDAAPASLIIKSPALGDFPPGGIRPEARRALEGRRSRIPEALSSDFMGQRLDRRPGRSRRQSVRIGFCE